MTEKSPSLDPSLDPRALCGSVDWVAMRMGRNKDWIYNNRSKLREAGMPEKDAVLGLWIKAEIDAWIARRAKGVTIEGEDHVMMENLDAL